MKGAVEVEKTSKNNGSYAEVGRTAKIQQNKWHVEQSNRILSVAELFIPKKRTYEEDEMVDLFFILTWMGIR